MKASLTGVTIAAFNQPHREHTMKPTTIKAGLLSLALGLPTFASAATFNYNYLEAGFGELDDGEALFVNGAFDIDKNWGLVGGLAFGDVDPDVDVTSLQVGAQYHQPLKGNLSMQAGARLWYIEADYPTGPFGSGSASDDDIGLFANVGLRFQVQPRFQLEGDIVLTSNDMLQDDGLGLQAAGRYYIDQRLSVAGGLAVDSLLDGLFISVRYDL